ncbi:MAG: hypothetical protein ACFFDC_11460 [Promethearchaeota archaeon]
MVCYMRGKIERIRAWFLVWYSLEAMLIFFIVIGRMLSQESLRNTPINALFALFCMAWAGSLEWPGVIFLSFITGAFITPIFMLINGVILISSITSILIEYKYNISYPLVSGLLKRINENLIREIAAGIFVWYIFEIIVIFSISLLYSMIIYRTADPIKVGILSVFWPIFIFLVSLLVPAASNDLFLIFFGSSLIFLIITLILESKFHFAYLKVLNI